MRSVAVALALAFACVGARAVDAPTPPRPGIEFQGATVRALQADEFGNPGMLWVTRGEQLWSERGCVRCHGDATQSMKGVAARHPRFDPKLGRVVNLEDRINACVVREPRAKPLAWESEPLLALTTFVAKQSHGMPVVADDHPGGAAVLARGRHLYFERQGQLNLACTQCHDGAWGRTLFAETVSQGQPADWPAYRLEWQTLGSLQRRLRACYFGVRAALPDFGSPDLLALELYLAKRGNGVVTSSPGVRK